MNGDRGRGPTPREGVGRAQREGGVLGDAAVEGMLDFFMSTDYNRPPWWGI